MRSPMSRWLTEIGVGAAAFGSLYAWKAYGIEPAGNLFIFWMWFTAIVGCIALIIHREHMIKTIPPRLPGLEVFCRAEDIILVCCLVWIGYFTLAAFSVIGFFGICSYVSRYDADGKMIEREAEHA